MVIATGLGLSYPKRAVNAPPPRLTIHSGTGVMLCDLMTVDLAIAELLLATGSLISDTTLAELLIDVPLSRSPLTKALKVIVSVEPELIEAKLTVRLLPVPPHTPTPLAEHEVKARLDGRLSETTTFVA